MAPWGQRALGPSSLGGAPVNILRPQHWSHDPPNPEAHESPPNLRENLGSAHAPHAPFKESAADALSRRQGAQCSLSTILHETTPLEPESLALCSTLRGSALATLAPLRHPFLRSHLVPVAKFHHSLTANSGPLMYILGVRLLNTRAISSSLITILLHLPCPNKTGLLCCFRRTFVEPAEASMQQQANKSRGRCTYDTVRYNSLAPPLGVGFSVLGF